MLKVESLDQSRGSAFSSVGDCPLGAAYSILILKATGDEGQVDGVSHMLNREYATTRRPGIDDGRRHGINRKGPDIGGR